MKRNYGIDLLRIMSMFMVIILHVLHQGGIEKSLTPFTVQYEVMWFLEIACYCAVNCYALISGYVGVSAKYRISNFVNLWSIVVFYTLLTTAVFYFVYPNTVGINEIVSALFPVITSQYWYFTAYFVLFLFMPLFNNSISNLKNKQLTTILVMLFIAFSLMPTLLRKDIFFTKNGFSGLWLIILYIIGACLRKTNLLDKLSATKSFVGYLSMIVISFISKKVIPQLSFNESFELSDMWLISYISPTILLSAIFLLALFSKLRLSETGCRVIKIIAPLSFSVYIIHCHPLIIDHLILNRFVSYVDMSTPALLRTVFFAALAIFGICAVIDLIRTLLFNLLHIPKIIRGIDNIIFKGEE